VELEDLKIGNLYKINPSGITFFQDFNAALAHYNYHGFDFSLAENGLPIEAEIDHTDKIIFLPTNGSHYELVSFLLLECRIAYRSFWKTHKGRKNYFGLQMLEKEKIFWCILSPEDMRICIKEM